MKANDKQLGKCLFFAILYMLMLLVLCYKFFGICSGAFYLILRDFPIEVVKQHLHNQDNLPRNPPLYPFMRSRRRGIAYQKAASRKTASSLRAPAGVFYG